MHGTRACGSRVCAYVRDVVIPVRRVSDFFVRVDDSQVLHLKVSDITTLYTVGGGLSGGTRLNCDVLQTRSGILKMERSV